MMQQLVMSLPQIGLTYQEYLAEVGRFAGLDPACAATDIERERCAVGPLNLQRMTRIGKTFTPSAETVELMRGISSPQRWMIISEPWCGDSAQSIPIIARIAELSTAVELRCVLRDRHPGVMDLFLTDGARSIPKLVAFSPEGEILFQWGPRPAGGMAVVAEAKAEGVSKQVREERLHRWFAGDRGAQMEKELRACITRQRPAADVPA